jgi:SAM-dependent methyltransferase
VTTYWDDLAHHTVLDDIWLSHPRVRERVNRRVSGDPAVWPTTWLRDRLGARRPLGRAASIGCGVGNLERDLIGQGIVQQIVGLDVSASCLRQAADHAAAAGVSSQVSYVQADARDWLRGTVDLDAVFFHSSLHHFDRLDELLALVEGSLRPGGLLYLDEYVGPARDEWRLRDLLLHNALYYLLPKSVRRVGRIRAPINTDDPTEAVESSGILSAVADRFDILERRDYGGSLLTILYANLRRPDQGADPRDFAESIDFLLDVEDLLLAHPRLTRIPTYCSVVLAERRA